MKKTNGFLKLPKLLVEMKFLNFFNAKELLEIGKLNKDFSLLIKKYFSKIENQLKIIRQKYDVDEILEDEVKIESFTKIYQVRNENHHYIIKLNEKKPIMHIGIFNKINWPWKNDEFYWTQKKFKNSLVGSTAYLEKVCWIDINMKLIIKDIGNYSICLRHGLIELEKYSLILSVYIDDKKIIENDYPSENMITEYKQKNNENDKNNAYLDEYKICCVQQQNFQIDKEDHSIEVKFKHKNLFWKHNWAIDSLIIAREDKINQTNKKYFSCPYQ